MRDTLAAGQPARAVVPTAEEGPAYRGFNLLTSKPVLYAANVAEDELAAGNRHVDAIRAALAKDGETAEVVAFSAKVEAELAELAPEDRAEFLESLGVSESGLDRLAHAAYHLLGLQSYFTAGEKEVRAWTIHQGDKAPAAAGVIHSDFEKGFIRAETVAYDDFVRVGGWKGGPGAGPRPGRRQGIRGAGRRRPAVPLQHLAGGSLKPPPGLYFPPHKPSSPAPAPARGDSDRRKVS